MLQGSMFILPSLLLSYALHCTPSQTGLSLALRDKELMDESRIFDSLMLVAIPVLLFLVNWGFLKLLRRFSDFSINNRKGGPPTPFGQKTRPGRP